MIKIIRSGFTLIELVAVMLLIAILSVAIIPSFNNNNYQAYLAADQILATLRYARQFAVNTNAPVTVDLDTTVSGRYGIRLTQGTATTRGTSQAMTNPATNVSPYIVLLPTGLYLSISTFYFDAWGRVATTDTASPQTQQTITISRNAGTAYTIYIEGASGYAHL
jgi:prepilin-type N-terminal cleavage/methylation domain-containing protein